MPDVTEPARPGQERFVAPLEETPLRAIDAIDVDAVPESQWREAWKRLRMSPLFWVRRCHHPGDRLVIAFPGLFTDVDPNYRHAEQQLRPGPAKGIRSGSPSRAATSGPAPSTAPAPRWPSAC